MDLNLSFHTFTIFVFSADFQVKQTMEKWMIVYVLPLEVWMDIFCFPWIKRRKFGQFVDQIGNFKFAEHAQFYLHEWGKRTMRELYFNKDGLDKSCPYDVEHFGKPHSYMEIPQTPLPENIRYLGNIQIDHFDANTLDFLDKVRPLLTDLKMQIPVDYSNEPNKLEMLRTALTRLTPFLHGIHSLDCCDSKLPLVWQCFGEKLLARLKVLKYEHFGIGIAAEMVQENLDTIMGWLTQNAEDGPKKLTIFSGDSGFHTQFFAALRQQFLAAKTPSTFSLILDQSDNFHLENSIGEVLHGDFGENLPTLQITRHPAGCNTKEVQEWINGMCRKQGGRIEIYAPTIGSFDAAQLDVPRVNVVEQQEERQPCSSKDA